MTDPIVTHADLTAINVLVGVAEGEGLPTGVCDLLERLRAAAEADAPPLPEGWVVYTDTAGDETVLWHVDGGWLRSWRKNGDVQNIEHFKGTLTPLRPTITEADVEKAAHRLWRNVQTIGISDAQRDALRAAFTAAGVVIEP